MVKKLIFIFIASNNLLYPLNMSNELTPKIILDDVIKSDKNYIIGQLLKTASPTKEMNESVTIMLNRKFGSSIQYVPSNGESIGLEPLD